MRTVMIILGGFALLAAFLGVAQVLGNNGTVSTSWAIKIFIGVWLVAAAVNMWIGVAQAGYSFTEELPIFLVIFSLPTAAALFIQWKFL